MTPPICFMLKGQIPSKKNSKRIVRFGNRSALIGSQAYLDWKEAAWWDLKAQLATMPLRNLNWHPVQVAIDFWVPNNRRRDLTNMGESLMDLLVDHDVLDDDNLREVARVIYTARGVDKADPRAEITISRKCKCNELHRTGD
ncbi:MAG: RusA family crossover junction endodeoxyribonuclease [Patescibacteria group bacterium]|nr:RusA family crossover junction endodeoxyribonuclease [Patescibacteria group bacterium]